MKATQTAARWRQWWLAAPRNRRLAVDPTSRRIAIAAVVWWAVGMIFLGFGVDENSALSTLHGVIPFAAVIWIACRGRL